MLQSVKISELPSADTLTEDDLIVIDQPDNTKKATLFQVLNHLEDSVGQSTLAVLAQPDGWKLIGKCPDIATLRTINPSSPGQSIVLVRAVPNGPVINATITHDPSDTTTAEDGYSVWVSPGGARWKADVSAGLDIRLAGLLTDGSNFGSTLNKVVVSEVKKAVASSSLLGAIKKITVPAKLSPTEKLNLTLDEAVVWPSFMSLIFEDGAKISYSQTSGVAFSVNNYPFYTAYGLNGWNLELFVHIHSARLDSLGGQIEFVGVSASGDTSSTATGILFGNTNGNTTNTGILNVRGFTINNVKVSEFYRGLDMTVQSTYLNTISNSVFTKNYFNVANTIADVSNGGERVRFVNCTFGNATSHGIYWGAISAGIVFDSCSFDYNGGSTICFSYYGRGNRFIFTNQCWFEGWGEGRYLIEAENSGAWASSLHNTLIFESGTYVLPRNAATGADWPRRPIFKNRSNVTDYVFMSGVFIEFKGKGAAKEGALVELGSQTRMSLVFKDMLKYPQAYLTNYRNTLNYGLYNFSGTVGDSIKGLIDSGTQMSFTTINEDSALTMVYGNVDTSDSNTYTQAQDVKITSTTISSRFVVWNPNIRVSLNNPDDEVLGCITIDPANITSGNLVINMRLLVYKASDLSTPVATYYGGDVKISDYSAANGDASGKVTMVCSASVPATTVAAYGGPLVVVPALHFIGAIGSYNIRLPAFWRG